MNIDIFYPLRISHGYIYEQITNYRKNQDFYQSILSSDKKKVLLLGTPTHSNIGDSAIVLAERAFLEMCGIPSEDIVEITFGDFRRMDYSLKKILKNCSIICWHGGGNMGTLWSHEEDLRQRGLKRMPSSFPSFIFPQTIHFHAPQPDQYAKKQFARVYNKSQALTIAAREQISYHTMCELFPNAEIILSPDIVLSCSADTFGVKKHSREEILLCLRNDKERAISDDDKNLLECVINKTGVIWRYTDMYAEHPITPENRASIVKEKMSEFASAKLVITDRLHGMVFAALTGTPCIVIPNNNHKVLGTYEWLQHLPYICFAHTRIDSSLIQKMLDLPEGNFSALPLLQHFEALKNSIISKMK